jgi:hypothetical protein
MKFDDPFTKSDVIRADKATVTPHMIADATFEGVRAAHTFQKFYLKPLLQGLINPSPKEEAIVGLHYRLAAYLSSLCRLNAPIHFQAVAASSRSIFELGLDMILISQDSTNESIERLHAFTRVERYRVAKKAVDFFSVNPVPGNMDISKQRALCSDLNQKSQVESLIDQYWGRNRNGDLIWPKHWSRFQDARGRSSHVGAPWEERYVCTYYMFNWHVHSGLAGVANISKDLFNGFAMEAFQLSTDVVLDTYRILGRELQLARAMPEWEDRLAFLDRVIGLSLVDKRLQSLKEPMRFRYWEEHEKDFA